MIAATNLYFNIGCDLGAGFFELGFAGINVAGQHNSLRSGAALNESPFDE